MGKQGRKKVEREFDRNIVVNAYIEEIKNVQYIKIYRKCDKIYQNKN